MKYLLLGVVLLVAVACGESPSATAPAAVAPTPIAAAPSASTAPVVVPKTATITGKGSKVTGHFTFTEGQFKVTWTTKGDAYFGVDMHRVSAGSDYVNLVNEVVSRSNASGETLFDSLGGSDYYLVLDASGVTWTITFTPIT